MRIFSILAILSILWSESFSQNDSSLVSRLLETAKNMKASGNKAEEARAYDQIAHFYWNQNSFSMAAKYYEKSVLVNNEIGNKNAIALIYNNLGIIYSDLNQTDKSIACFQKNLEYNRSINSKSGIVSALINISTILNEAQRCEQSLKKLKEAESLALELNDVQLLKNCYKLLSEAYGKTNNSEQMQVYFEKYRSFNEKIQKDEITKTNDQLKISESEKLNSEMQLQIKNKELNKVASVQRELYSHLSKIELQNELLKKDTLLKSIAIQQKATQEKTQRIQIYSLGAIIALLALVSIVLVRGYYHKQKTSKQLSRQNSEIMAQKEELAKLSVVASGTDNAVIITDKEGTIEWVNEAFSRIFGFTTEDLIADKRNIIKSNKDEKIITPILKVIETKKTNIYEIQLQNKENESIWVSTTLTPILDENQSISKLIFINSDINRLKKYEAEISAQKKEIEEQKLELTDSINCAKTIQNSMLKRNANLAHHISEHFILFNPLATVSGDFYWFANVGEKTIIVAADCTGHGVPGAFMSMIGMNLLNTIIELRGTTKPDQIIEELDFGIKNALNQEETNDRHGMDVAIVTLDKKENQLLFASAGRSLVLIQNNEMQVIRGDKKSVGDTLLQANDKIGFELYSFDLKTPTSFYIYSDGYSSQFSETTRKKYSNKRFFELIKNNFHKPFSEQKLVMEAEFNEWMGNEPQIDDVLVIGVKV